MCLCREILSEERCPGFLLEAVRSAINKRRKLIKAKMLGIPVSECSSRSLIHTTLITSRNNISPAWTYVQKITQLCFFPYQWWGGEDLSVWAHRSWWCRSWWSWQTSWVTHSESVSRASGLTATLHCSDLNPRDMHGDLIQRNAVLVLGQWRAFSFASNWFLMTQRSDWMSVFTGLRVPLDKQLGFNAICSMHGDEEQTSRHMTTFLIYKCRFLIQGFGNMLT